MGARDHIYLIPGMFGFARLAGYEYFIHLEQAFSERFSRAGRELELHIVPSPPTASLTVRASVLAGVLNETLHDDRAQAHLVGHSTGGLDARLLLSPACRLPLPSGADRKLSQVRSVVSLSCPHFGTPLAGYFATVAGTRMLYALSLLTVTSLSMGRLPLTAFSGMVAAVGAVDEKLGVDVRLLDQLTDYILRFVGERGRGEIHEYLEHVRCDRGGIIHLMPEVLEVFNATVPDNPAVRYGCVASAAPAPGPRRFLKGLRSPFAALSLAAYSSVYSVASRADARYPYAAPDRQQRNVLERGCPFALRPEMVDGIVPTLSMLWGELLWCGAADHLDVVGHFADGDLPVAHVDWLESGARFGRREFAAMADAVCDFLLRDA